MNPIITTLIIIAIIAIAIYVGVQIIKHKLNKLTREFLGKNLHETTNLIKKGLKEEANTPKAISNVSPMYMPQLLKDFPDMTHERFIEMAKSSLLSILDCIEKENTGSLKEVTRELQTQVDTRISDNKGKSVVEHFDNVVIHKAGISNYRTTSESAEADFEISFQCNHFFEGAKASAKNKDTLSQMAARITLNYGKEEAESGVTTFSHNCPNCGAPVYSVGGHMMVCKYCGTGVTEDVYKSWLTSRFKFI